MVDDAHFQAILYKLHAHTADNLRYNYPVPYSHRFIDTLRLKPAAYLPGASLEEVCTHFGQHYGQITDPKKRFDPKYEASLDPDKRGPEYSWCLIIDDECLQGLELSPEPIGPRPLADVDFAALESNTDMFVKMLSRYYNTMEKPEILAAQGRGGTGRRIEWNGWLKFSPVQMMHAFREANVSEVETWFSSEDEIVNFPS